MIFMISRLCNPLKLTFNTTYQRSITFFCYFKFISILYIRFQLRNKMTDKNTAKQKKSTQHTHLKQMSTENLKKFLFELQKKHDMLQIKNQQLGNQANDLRKVVKCVQSQREQQIEHSLIKKKKLKQEIQRLQKALEVAHNNDQYEKMLAFKDLMKE